MTAIECINAAMDKRGVPPESYTLTPKHRAELVEVLDWAVRTAKIWDDMDLAHALDYQLEVLK